jgi:Rhodopirellula transposase DDE domain
MTELSNELKALYIKTAQKLKGTDRRQFMAEVVKGLGLGGQTQAERELGWNRRTIRKGMGELTRGEAIEDGYERSGRKRVETQLPNLLEDIKSLIDAQSQTDPSFKSNRLYCRLSVAEVRRQLVALKGYQSETLPSHETIRQRINLLGYRLRRVAKIKPKKRIAATDAIFEQMHQVNQQADADPTQLRLSMDAKVAVKVGEFDRGGKSRVPTVAADHDFDAVASLTPYGIFLPQYNELSLFFVCSKLTADCIVDLLETWWKTVKGHFSAVQTLVINQDNGPENHSRRTQFMHRIVQFAQKYHLRIQLAYYPPYHSKYNPVERTFGWLERHWNGSLLDEVETVLRFAETLNFKGNHPVVTLIKQVYQTGVKLSKQAMAEVERQLQRLPNLPKWFVEISGKSP